MQLKTKRRGIYNHKQNKTKYKMKGGMIAQATQLFTFGPVPPNGFSIAGQVGVKVAQGVRMAQDAGISGPGGKGKKGSRRSSKKSKKKDKKKETDSSSGDSGTPATGSTGSTSAPASAKPSTAKKTKDQKKLDKETKKIDKMKKENELVSSGLSKKEAQKKIQTK